MGFQNIGPPRSEAHLVERFWQHSELQARGGGLYPSLWEYLSDKLVHYC